MSLIEWDNKYNLDVLVIDQHHQHLVSLLNKSYDAIQLNSKQQTGIVLSELLEYATYHFEAEENMMLKYNFPTLQAHIKLHEYFINKICELQSKLNAGEALFNIQIVVFLKDWFMNHILVIDRVLADYLACQGVD